MPRDERDKPRINADLTAVEALRQQRRTTPSTLVKEDEVYSSEQQNTIIDETKAYRLNRRHGPKGNVLPWSVLAEEVGISPATLSELIKQKYKGDVQAMMRKLDLFLAKERDRQGRADFRSYVLTTVAKWMTALALTVIRNCGMGAIIAPPGVGKSIWARAFQREHGCCYIMVQPSHRDAKGIVELLCEALKILNVRTYKKQCMAIRKHLRQNRSLVILIDEAQHLTRSALEQIRALYDASDLDSRRNTPIIFVGDDTFYRSLQRAQNGESSVVAPQLLRRINPILDCAREAMDDDDGALYTVEDVVRVLRNDRIKITNSEGLRWLTKLANTNGFGAIGLMVKVVECATDICKERPVPVSAFVRALNLTTGRGQAVQIDDAAGNELIRRSA